jgi:hypothetical protein
VIVQHYEGGVQLHLKIPIAINARGSVTTSTVSVVDFTLRPGQETLNNKYTSSRYMLGQPYRRQCLDPLCFVKVGQLDNDIRQEEIKIEYLLYTIDCCRTFILNRKPLNININKC